MYMLYLLFQSVRIFLNISIVVSERSTMHLKQGCNSKNKEHAFTLYMHIHMSLYDVKRWHRYMYKSDVYTSIDGIDNITKSVTLYIAVMHYPYHKFGVI